MASLLLAIDQGTTGSSVALFDAHDLKLVSHKKTEFTQHFPTPGWVEHEPEDLWTSTLASLAAVLADGRDRLGADCASQLVGVGITNQRETCLAWNRRTGETAGRAIVWQDRRTADFCTKLAADSAARQEISRKTGLVCDPYFSGSKMRWMMRNLPKAKNWAAQGELVLGTVDAWLIYRLTAGKTSVTEHTNASRTMLYDLEKGDYDDALCELFEVPRESLPRVVPSCGEMGRVQKVPGLPDGLPVVAALGDQQAALFGQHCDLPGEAKITYGTGAFLLMNTGASPRASREGLLTTVAFSQGTQRTFALEGAAFIAGAAIQFVRDNFGWIRSSAECEALARSEPRDPGVIFVPALAGLSAPYWNAHARGALLGLTRGTGKGQIMRAVLESVALQNAQLLKLMENAAGKPLTRVGVDGGAARNDGLMQFQADILRTKLVRPRNSETTAQGAARAARRALATGTEKNQVPRDSAAGMGSLARELALEEDKSFSPAMEPEEALRITETWERAVKAVDSFYR